MHSNDETKKCHYFNNDKLCPYEEVGCNIFHIDAEMCFNGAECQNLLCSFKHKNIDSINEQSEKEILNGYANDMNTFKII